MFTIIKTIGDFLKETVICLQREAEEIREIKQIPILTWVRADHWKECAGVIRESIFRMGHISA